MKAIQLTMDEDLLRELDGSPEVQREGRSAVVRRATAEYLKRQKQRAIAEGYLRGYGASSPDDAELVGWAEEGIWPEE